MYTLKFSTHDDKIINLNVWDEVNNRVGIVLIAHGMAEHIDRYDDFAVFLNKAGYIVLGDDHRGHRNNYLGTKGLVEGDSFLDTVEDMKAIIEYAKSTYKLPVSLIGHSYGSFLSQRFLEMYSYELDKCILSGTAFIKSPLTAIGAVIANTQKAVFGKDATGNLIDKMSFGAFNKPFKSQMQQFAWLSRDKDQVSKYENDPDCGYPLSVGFYSSFFNNINKLYKEETRNIRLDLPILIAVGSNDPVSKNATLAIKLQKYYQQFGLNVDLKIYQDYRHEILNEIDNEDVYNDFLAFLNK